MGRPRKSNPLGLESRVYANHGAFFYVHRDGKWERLGTDKTEANRKARLYNDSNGEFGTVAYWLDMFLLDCEKRVAAKDMSPRTLSDYRTNVVPLKLYFAPPMMPQDIRPDHIQAYLDIGAKQGRPVPANRERACLSSCLSWLISNGLVPGMTVNPCMRASGIKRNSESQRERYVEHDECQDVYAEAGTSVRAMMELTYRTLQRPESDIIRWTTAVIAKKDGKRILRFKQYKTGKTVDIGLDGRLEALIDQLIGKVPTIHVPLIKTLKGEAYTYDGLSANLKKAIARANAKRKEEGKPRIASFGFRDLKGKGATDMWVSGVPIERIQLLCGHAKSSTTEIYVKARWRETAAPNQVQMAS